jgi:asparagine synthase (glutamine-hydrolysing)
MTLVTRAGAPDDEHVAAVVKALHLRDWVRVDARGRLDLLGADARSGLLRHGARYPSIGHVVVPGAQAAGGGTLVDCHGLREIWDFWRGTAIRGLVRRGRADRHAVQRAAVALSPRSVRRRAVEARLRSFDLPQVRPEVLDWLRERFADEAVTMPLTASGAIRRLHRRRCLWETARTFGSLGADHGAKVVHYFTDPAFAAALASAAGRRGWRDSAAMLAELTPEIPARASRPPGTPPEPFWEGPESAAFIEEWDGTGLDDTLVDPARMREAWRRRDARAGLLLQSAWLASDAAARERETAARVAPA